MHNLIRYYYQNKKAIWKIIIFVVVLLIVIQVINKIISIENQQINYGSNIYNNSISNSTYQEDTYIESNTSAVTGNTISSDKLSSAQEIIQNFVKACNEGNVEEAYNYLSNDCKQEKYPDISQFKTLYFDTIFEGNKKVVSIENWMSDTYKVSISDDIMSTGQTNEMKKQDYITVVEYGDELKININGFIGKEEIEKSQSFENIEFIINSKVTYIDYEEYEIKVNNKSNNKILLDSQQNTKSIYIEDNNNTKYYSYSHELLRNLLIVDKGFSTQFKIKFYKSYSLERSSKNIVFSDVILNYNDETLNEEFNSETIRIIIE